MQPDRLAVVSVAGLVVLLAVATGPQVGLLSIPEGGFGADAAPGEGTARLEVVSPPERATLVPADYADLHYIQITDPEVAVLAVSGAPLLTVTVAIPSLGYSRSSVFTIAEQGSEIRSYGIEGGAIASGRLDRDTYDGTVRLVLRDDAGETVLYEDRIAVEVTG